MFNDVITCDTYIVVPSCAVQLTSWKTYTRQVDVDQAKKKNFVLISNMDKITTIVRFKLVPISLLNKEICCRSKSKPNLRAASKSSLVAFKLPPTRPTWA